MHRQDHRGAGRLVEVEVGEQISEDRIVLADVGAPVGARVESLAAQDCVLIATDHSAYDYEFVAAHSRLVVDTRNATRSVARNRDRIVRA